MIAVLILAVGVIWWETRDDTENNNAGTTLSTYTDTENGISFQYPETLNTEYIKTTDWPPIVQIVDGPFNCTPAGVETERAGETKSVTINGRNYCVTKVTEGAAGSTYIQYAYGFQRNGRIPIMAFSLRFPQCGNYDDPKKTECETERANFDIYQIVDQMANSLNF